MGRQVGQLSPSWQAAAVRLRIGFGAAPRPVMAGAVIAWSGCEASLDWMLHIFAGSGGADTYGDVAVRMPIPGP